MATLTFQRATWCLQIARTPRLFSVSFTTALPGRGRLPAALPASNPPPSEHSSARRYQNAADSFLRAETRRRYTTAIPSHAPAASPSPAAEPTATARQGVSSSHNPTTSNLSEGLNDGSLEVASSADGNVDWTRSFQGLSNESFSPETAKVLLAPVDPDDVEVKPDGIIYLPEIKYRRILNQAFGPGGWGLAPRGETIITSKSVTREYALVALGRLVSIARGEQDYFDPEGIPTAVEGCKSSALRRCCKDLGIASELWDPRYIRKFIADNVREVFVEHAVTKRKRKVFLRKGDKPQYPYKETR